MDSRLFEEFLISGMAIPRVADDNPFESGTAAVSNVNPEKFFCNNFEDPRGRDIEIVGMLHDMSPAEALMRFDKVDRERLRRLIDTAECEVPTSLSGNAIYFFNAAPGRIRVIEVWTREFSTCSGVKWRVRWYSSTGQLLSTYLSPWAHGKHPFVLKFYPLTDGEIHSFVEDMVDQQRYINRIIILIDRIMSTSAKGVLLFPIKQKPSDMTFDEIARRWARTDGFIPITGHDQQLPVQVGGNNSDASAYRLLEMELRLFDRTAGVGAALTGGVGTTDTYTGSQHFDSQIESATAALADIFLTFRSLVKARNATLKSIMQ